MNNHSGGSVANPSKYGSLSVAFLPVSIKAILRVIPCATFLMKFRNLMPLYFALRPCVK